MATIGRRTMSWRALAAAPLVLVTITLAVDLVLGYLAHYGGGARHPRSSPRINDGKKDRVTLTTDLQERRVPRLGGQQKEHAKGASKGARRAYEEVIGQSKVQGSSEVWAGLHNSWSQPSRGRAKK
jgi:hypothetical protein